MVYLIKFNFTNRHRIPRWVPYSRRASDKVIDASRSMAMKNGHGIEGFQLAQVGRVREGRVDTGVNAKPQNYVKMDQIDPTMRELGNVMTDIHWFRHRREGKVDKLVLVLVYGKGKPFRLYRREAEDLQFFQESTWQHCHVWVNPEADNITVNLTSLTDMPARLSVGVNQGSLGFFPYEHIELSALAH